MQSRVNLGLFAESPSPVKAQVADRMVAACQGVAARKEDLKVRGDFEKAPQIEYGKASNIITALPLGKNLPAQGQPLAELTLEEPPAKVVVALLWGGIDGIAASPVGRPGSPTLLQSERKLSPGPAVTQPSISITRRDFELGKNAHHGSIIGFLDKTIL